MLTLISKDSQIVEKLASALNETTSKLLDLNTQAIASEFLSIDRAVEQLELFKTVINKKEKYDFKGKKLLEIGAGVGTFLITARTKYEIESYGIEPSEDEFSPFNEISSSLLSEYNLPKDIVVRGLAEALPFPSDSFDLIYSTNVLEHVQDPKKVLSESIRVLKPGGYLQFVIPNYFSFWEGHYAIFWPCITNKTFGKLYAKLLGKNPAYIDTLQLISPFYLRNIIKSFKDQIEVLGWGKDVFKKRLETGNYSDWASLQKIRPIVNLMQKLKIASVIANVLNKFEMYTPIVLTIKKIKQ
ncbi:MAG: class I SAM-dependent methyltransferase [Candidatus Melainabacteria bacterium]|nr:class I SAM-dependent methyltransferase [Candidatus Melainabacteria bacterium]